MAALVDSGLRNRPARKRERTADSVGFFQMRVERSGTQGEYRGLSLMQAAAPGEVVSSTHAIAGEGAAACATRRGVRRRQADPSSWGEWIADVERPAEQLRGRYQLRLEEARNLLKAPPTP